MMTVYTRMKYLDRALSKAIGGKYKYKIYICKETNGKCATYMV